MPTVSEVFERNRSDLRSVPSYRDGAVCSLCRGPVSGYARCYGCKELRDAAPFPLEGRVVPMSVAPSPGPWYSRLATYKTFHPEHMAVLASLTYLFLVTHQRRIAELLGGDFDHLAVVPSTRGVQAETQPLRRVLSMVEALEERASTPLRHVPGRKIARQSFAPDAFTCDAGVRGGRIVLLDDTWVTGAKAASAAGALYQAGAEAVLILPIARRVQPGVYYPEDHPYFGWMMEPYELLRWPL